MKFTLQQFFILLMFSSSLSSQDCGVFPIQLSQESDIDIYFSDKEKCDTLYEHLEIENFADLSGLNFIKKASTIRITLYQNNLKVLEGLDSLEEAKTIEIFANLSDLTRIKAFKSLKKLENLKISFADDLRYVDDLLIENLVSLEISTTGKLENLDFLPNLKFVNRLEISLNDNLKTLRSDDEFNLEIGTHCGLSANPKLEKLNISLVTESMLLFSLSQLPSLDQIIIKENVVKSLSSFFLNELPLIEDIPEFKLLKKASYFFGIVECPAIQILPNFLELDTVGQFGFYKTGLSDISGIKNLKVITDSLVLVGNNNLSSCNYKAICDLVEKEPTKARVSDNMPFCESVSSIENSCMESTTLNIQDEGIFSISPIPAKDYINIVTNKLSFPFDYSILNMDGQILQSGSLAEDKFIGISDLQAGLYILLIEGQTSRFLKH